MERIRSMLFLKIGVDNLYQIGNLIYLKRDETYSADIVIFDTSDVKDRNAYCYVDTSFVDGSKTLVKKEAL